MATTPLFPLNKALFPAGVLHLRIFEVRYLDMIRACLAERREFGVVALLQGNEVRTPESQEVFAGIGTMARIDYSDATAPGLIQLRCVGTSRFRVRSSWQGRYGLWMADVDPIDDDPVQAWPSAPCASSPPSAATWTCASRPRPAPRKASPGHQLVAGRRGAGYEPRSACAANSRPGGARPRRRLRPRSNRLEEIKTHRGDLARSRPTTATCTGPRPRSTAGCCARRAAGPNDLALVYFDIGTQKETDLRRGRTTARPARVLRDQCRVSWPGRAGSWRTAPRAMRRWLALAFPHAGFRTGQRELAEAVYKRAAHRPLPAGAGAHRHRQDRGHALPMLKACPGRDRQGVLPDRQDDRPASWRWMPLR
jgi:hypothetical protein